MPPWMYSDLKPHGTMAAVRRHRRHGERLCRDCHQAELRHAQDRRSERSQQGRHDGGPEKRHARYIAERKGTTP